jgi:hypothetical protein
MFWFYVIRTQKVLSFYLSEKFKFYEHFLLAMDKWTLIFEMLEVEMSVLSFSVSLFLLHIFFIELH